MRTKAHPKRHILRRVKAKEEVPPTNDQESKLYYLETMERPPEQEPVKKAEPVSAPAVSPATSEAICSRCGRTVEKAEWCPKCEACFFCCTCESGEPD